MVDSFVGFIVYRIKVGKSANFVRLGDWSAHPPSSRGEKRKGKGKETELAVASESSEKQTWVTLLAARDNMMVGRP